MALMKKLNLVRKNLQISIEMPQQKVLVKINPQLEILNHQIKDLNLKSEKR